MRLSNKIIGQRYAKERLKSSLKTFYGRYFDLSKQYKELQSPEYYTTFLRITYPITPCIDQAFHQFLTLLLIWTLLPIWRFTWLLGLPFWD